MIARTKLTPNGPEFSRVVYGTWRMLDDGSTAQDVNGRLLRCLDLGITTIDTAEIYGGYAVEAVLGEALALSPGLRDKVELITKSGIYIPHKTAPGVRVGHYDATAARLKQSVETSLNLLGTDQLDLFLVHRPDWLTSVDDTAEGLNRLLKSGKIRSVGVSNYSATQFAALSSRMDQPLATNQVEFSLLHMDPVYDGVFDQCQAEHVQPMAWSPLAGGSLFDQASPAGARLVREAATLAPKYGNATLEQLAYAWVMAHPANALPIVGTNKISRIESAAAAANITLSREDWYALWVAAKGHGIP
ncbi:MAG: aldo/keto reductase [bacterium]